MRKALLAASMLALVGCSEIQYRTHGDELQNYQDWKDGDVSFHDAKLYEYNGVKYNSYCNYSYMGLSNPNDIITLNRIYPADSIEVTNQCRILTSANDDDFYNRNKEQDPYYKGVRKIVQSIEMGMFTAGDVEKVIEYSEELNKEGKNNWLGGGNGTSIPYVDVLISSAKKVHNGIPVGDVVEENIKKERREESFENQREAEQKKRDAEEERQNAINRFGQDIIDKCGGRIISFQPTFVGQDPYAYVGKCVSMELPEFMPPNLGTRQWIGPNALLSTIFFGEVANTFVVEADEHVKIGTPLVAIGVDPIQYQNGLGTLQTPVTFKVLRFY